MPQSTQLLYYMFSSSSSPRGNRCSQTAATENQFNLFIEKILSKKQLIPYQEGCTQELCTIYELDPKALHVFEW